MPVLPDGGADEMKSGPRGSAAEPALCVCSYARMYAPSSSGVSAR